MPHHNPTPHALNPLGPSTGMLAKAHAALADDPTLTVLDEVTRRVDAARTFLAVGDTPGADWQLAWAEAYLAAGR